MLHSLYSFLKSDLAQLDIFDCTKLFITLLKKALVQPFLFTLCHQFYMICSSKLIFNILAKQTKIRFSWRKKSNTTGKLEVNFKCQDWFEEVIWRFAIVKLNKAARLSVPYPEKVSIWKFPLWDLRLLWKHYTEMILLSDEKQSFMLAIYNITMVIMRPCKWFKGSW